MDKVKHEADRREIEVVILPTAEAIKTLQENPVKTNAILGHSSDPDLDPFDLLTVISVLDSKLDLLHTAKRFSPTSFR